jgi:hypothetical protein
MAPTGCKSKAEESRQLQKLLWMLVCKEGNGLDEQESSETAPSPDRAVDSTDDAFGLTMKGLWT